MLRQFGYMLLRGLSVLLPILVTVWVVRWCFLTIDGAFQPSLLSAPIPGLGIVVILALAAVVGVLTMNATTRGYVNHAENGIDKIPLLKNVYATIKDFVDAFIGEKRRFDRPVLVRLGAGLDADVIGFLTADDLSSLGLTGKVAVYFPQSYNIGGNLLILSPERIVPITADSGTVMSFLVSGGVARMPELPPVAQRRFRSMFRRVRTNQDAATTARAP
ncbi:MAG: DUF502 domain-containing protein [Planctomycetota bacterium]